MTTDTDRIEFLEGFAVSASGDLQLVIDYVDGAVLYLYGTAELHEFRGATVRSAIDQCIEKMREPL